MINKRNQAQPIRNIRTLYWIVWTFGTALIVLSWLRMVSYTIGWIGWGMAGIATLVSVVYNLSAKRQNRAVREYDSENPTSVSFAKTLIKIDLVDGRSISAPLRWYPKLKQASSEDRAHYEFQGTAIYWPELKADVSIPDVLDGVPPGE